MHAHAFDQFHFKDSLIHRLDPRIKVILLVLYILSNAFLPDGSWLAFSTAWLFLLAANDASQLGLGFTFKRSFIILPFVVVALSAVFSPLGEPLVVWKIGSIQLQPTDFGLIRFFSIMIRSWLSVQIAILLVATTQFPDIVHAFEHLRIPRVITTIVAFLYRYLFVLTDETFRLLRARDARSAGISGQRKGGSLQWRAKVTGSMAGQMFLRSYERSDRIHNAMLARGYAGHIRTFNPHEMNRTDWSVLLIGFISLIIIQVVGWIL